MSVDTLLTIALDLAYFVLFAFTLLDYLRHRDPVRRAVVLVFGSLAIVLGAPLLGTLPGIGPLIGVAVLPALLAQPVLVLWLASYVRPVPRTALLVSVLAFVVLTGALLAVVAGGSASSSPLVTILLLVLLAYFALLEGAAAIGFALAARSRAGASRTRLLTASFATGLLGLALVVLLGGGLATTPGSEASAAIGAIVRVVALLSALGYLAAFAPPRALRRLSQQAIVYDFVRDLNALPSGSPAETTWRLLERTAAGASGATRAQLAIDDPVSEPQAGARRATFPLDSERWPNGRLELDLPRHALFLDDDVALTGLLVDRATRAAERDSFVIERERLIAELQAASAAKSDFLAAMSHELRTPLNAIIGFSELLTEGGDEAADPATVATYSEHIHGSGLHLLELVNDVLDLARVEAGRLDLKPVEFELDDLVRQTVATLQPLADQKRHTMTLELDALAVEADPSRVRQIVVNLLSNAIKFTEAGGEIRVSLALDPTGEARLTVADTGCGIGPADIDRIFEAFHQAESGTSRQEGTGLGLALTRQLVEAHRGRIDVSSEIGVGSEFTVRLPIQQIVVESGLEPAPVIPTGKPTVLVIEDDSAARELLRLHLEGAGYSVLATGSGRQGLAWVAEVRPDAVLLDIVLPDIDGWEILQHLKADPQTRAIPVMVVSVVDNRQLGLALGAVDYFVKPIAREPLLQAIGRLTFTTKVRTRTVTALVIDADPDAFRRYRELLEPDGFRVIAASDGATGHQRALADQPDLILLDFALPDVDGFELAATLRHDPGTSTIPIWLTAPAGLMPEAKARLNGNVQGILEQGEDALAAMHGWLEVGRSVAAAISPTAAASPAVSAPTAATVRKTSKAPA